MLKTKVRRTVFMKLNLEQKPDGDIEVTIRYMQMDESVKRLISLIESSGYALVGSDNGRQYKISAADIYYIESVDKRTFIYTKEQVYRSEKPLYKLIDELKGFGFLQVSKFCILNLDMLSHIVTLKNSRLETTLTNGERITVSRTYIPAIKQALQKGLNLE